MSASMSPRHQVVIIGSGFGGLFAAKRLKRANVDVTLIGRTTHHLFQPLLYQVATGILSEGEVAPATREILRRRKDVRVILGEVTDIDLAAHTVTAVAGAVTTTTHYDSLIVQRGGGPLLEAVGRAAPPGPAAPDAEATRGLGRAALAPSVRPRNEPNEPLLSAMYRRSVMPMRSNVSFEIDFRRKKQSFHHNCFRSRRGNTIMRTYYFKSPLLEK